MKEDKIVKSFESIQKHPIKSLLLMACLFICLMLIIGLPYLIGNIKAFFNVEYESALLFLGSFLTFIGTMFLGIVSYTQNSRLSNENAKLQKKLHTQKIEWDKEQQKIQEANWLNSVKNLILSYKNILNNNFPSKISDPDMWKIVPLDLTLLNNLIIAQSIFGDNFSSYYTSMLELMACESSKSEVVSKHSNSEIAYEEYDKYMDNLLAIENDCIERFVIVLEKV